ASGDVGEAPDEICRAPHFLQIGSKSFESGALDVAGEIGRQRFPDSLFNLGHYVIPPSAGIADERLVERGRMTQIGYNFRKNGIRDGLAVGDHAIEVKNDRAHYVDSNKEARILWELRSRSGAV